MLDRRMFVAAGAAAFASPWLSAAEDEKAKFKLGLVTYNVPSTWDLPTLLKICQSVGVAAVECRTTHKHGVEPKLTKDERMEVKKRFADSSVVFWGCGSVCEFHSDDAAVVKKNIEECKAFLDLVKDLGGRGVKVRPNGVAKSHTVEQACQQIGTSLQECGKAADALGLEIWVEVHGNPTSIPKNMKMIFDACAHKAVGATWNSNPTDLVDGKLDAAFDLLKPFIKSCHINDLFNDKLGKYPYRELFKKLWGIDYDRYTLCEVGKTYEPEAGKEFLIEYKKLWESLVAG